MFRRYVAIGDSTTEGLDDPDGSGGYRGWANRLAEHLARVQGTVDYANLAVRGLRTRQILETQLAAAVAMRPDLVTAVSGTNDLMALRFDAPAVARDMEEMQRALVGIGARVVTFTLPDLSRFLPFGRRLGARITALNDSLRDVAGRTGVTLVDFAAFEAALDTRFWSDDRLHANARGHERIAAALAHAIGLPGFDDSWKRGLEPAPPAGLRERVATEVAWARRHLLPWLWRHARGRSSGDGRTAKRPRLEPFPGVAYQK